MALLLFILLPALAACDMTLTFKDFAEKYDLTIDMEGQDRHVISDNETMTFLLDDHVLRSAAEKYSANRPKTVYLRNPPRGGDFYKSNWSQIELTVKPVAYEVFNFKSQNVVLASILLDHNDRTKHHLVGNVTDTVETKWYSGGPINVTEKVVYSIRADSNTLTSDRLVYNIKTAWEENFKKSRVLQIAHDVQLFLDKHETRKVVLRATRVVLDVVVIYLSTLQGMAVCNYYPQTFHFGESYLSYPITPMLKAGELPTSVTTSKIISMVVHMDPLMIVMDAVTNQTKMSYGAHVQVKE